jgi:hypothetical protein
LLLRSLNRLSDSASAARQREFGKRALNGYDFRSQLSEQLVRTFFRQFPDPLGAQS